MKEWVQMLVIFLLCVIGLLLIAVNVNIYDKSQNKAQISFVE